MTDNWLSDCHQAPVKVVGADEGTNHWECTQCGKACNAHQTDNTIDSEVRALDTIQRNIWARINDEVNLRGIKLSIGDAYALGSVIKEVLHPEVTNLIAQEAKAFGGCRNCYGKGYATVRKGTTAKGKTWDLRTHINYCSCDRGKQLQQVMAQEANKARLDELRIMWDWPKDKGLAYFEQRIQKREAELIRLTAEKGSNNG